MRHPKQMKICLTVPSFSREFGGPSFKALHLARALRALDLEIEVVGCGESSEGRSLPVLGRFHANQIPRRLGPLQEVIGWADIVHVLGYREPVSALATWISWRRDVPYLIEPFGSYGRWSRSLRIKVLFDLIAHRTVVPNAVGFIATSQLEAGRLVAEGLDRNRIHVRPNGLAFSGRTDAIEKGAFRRGLGIPEHAPLVLCISRLARTKDLQVLMLAMTQPKLRDTWCVIAGPDYEDGTLPMLLELRQGLDLGSRVVILQEGLWEADKWAALGDADCFCLPSKSESFGNAALEAAAAGLPVAVSSGCGGREWLSSESSEAFPPGDSVALAEALVRLLTEPMRTKASAAATEVAEGLSWDTVARMQAAIYESALSFDDA